MNSNIIIFSIMFMLLGAVEYSYAGAAIPDVDECQDPDVCGDNSFCVNSMGAFSCQCKSGFSIKGDGSNKNCTDTDECLDSSDSCGNNTECVNMVGGYYCTCHMGFTFERNEMPRRNCTGSCGTAIFSDATGIIGSPGYPSNYPHGANCSYTIEIGTEKKVLELDVFALDIDCPFDWLDIGGRKICGNMTETTFQHVSGDVVITFISDGAVTRRGFQILYKIMSPEDVSRNRGVWCNTKRKCDYFCPHGYVFDRVGQIKCPSCACQTSMDTIPKCGDKIRCPCAYGRDSQQCPTCDCIPKANVPMVPPANIMCNMTFKDIKTPLFIASPDFDGYNEYPNNTTCSVTLDTGTRASRVNLNFVFMDIEASEGCEVAAVTFLNVRLCGQQPRTYTIENVQEPLIVYFASDGNRNGSIGFFLEVRVYEEPPVKCCKGDTQLLLELSFERISIAEKTLSVIAQALSQITGLRRKSYLPHIRPYFPFYLEKMPYTGPEVEPEVTPPHPQMAQTVPDDIQPDMSPSPLNINSVTTISTRSMVMRPKTKKPKLKKNEPSVKSTVSRVKTGKPKKSKSENTNKSKKAKKKKG